MLGNASQSSSIPMTHIAIDMLCQLVEDAFQGASPLSLMSNLVNLREGDLTTLSPGAGRTIADILEHVGWCKWMYEDYAFGTASLRGDQPPLIPSGGERFRPYGDLISWLSAGHAKWLASIRALQEDGELDHPRLTNWGELLPTLTIIQIMIGHDYYHAGEINHLRSLLQGNDRWEYK